MSIRVFILTSRIERAIRRVIERISYAQPPAERDPEVEDQSVAMKEAFTEYGILVSSGD